MTYTQAQEEARRITRQSAQLKPWRFTRQQDRELHQLAKTITESGPGYIEATPRGLVERYGAKECYLTGTAADIHVKLWAIIYGPPQSEKQFRKGIYTLSFIPIL